MEIILENDSPSMCLLDTEQAPVLKKLYDVVNGNPNTQVLLIKVLKELDDNQIKCLRVDLSENTTSGFDAEYCLNGRITLKQSLSRREMLWKFIFELANASQHSKFCQINKDLVEGTISCDECYARATEQVEYATLLTTSMVFNATGWEKHPELISLEDGLKSGFNSYYKKILADEHKYHYRKFWFECDIEQSQTNYQESLEKKSNLTERILKYIRTKINPKAEWCAVKHTLGID